MTAIEIVELASSIVGMLTGIAGMVFGFLSRANSKARVASDYLAAMHDPKFIEAREHVYHMCRDLKQELSIDDTQAAEVINFYHTWGAMARHGYLPMWVFEERMSGLGAMRLYKMLEPLIGKLTEAHEDNTYANGYVWLYNKLEKLYSIQ